MENRTGRGRNRGNQGRREGKKERVREEERAREEEGGKQADGENRRGRSREWAGGSTAGQDGPLRAAASQDQTHQHSTEEEPAVGADGIQGEKCGGKTGQVEDVLVLDTLKHWTRQMNKTPRLNRQEEADLVRRTRSGDAKARTQLVEANLRLVYRITMRLTGRGLPAPDLLQEGVIGLITAVDRFDPGEGNRLSTFATYWIRGAILTALSEGKTSAVEAGPIPPGDEQAEIQPTPGGEAESRSTARDAAERGWIPDEGKDNGWIPDEGDKGEGGGRNKEMSPIPAERKARVEEIIRQAHRPAVPAHQIHWVEMVSLSSPVGEQGGGDSSDNTLEEILEDPGASSPEKETFRTLLRERISEALKTLSPRERQVIELLYGLEDDNPRTRTEVSLLLGITRWRVMQLEERAFHQLRMPGRFHGLKEYVEG